MAKKKPMPPDEPDTMGMPDEPDMTGGDMAGGVPDGHAQAAQRNAASMMGMQQKMRQQLGKPGY